jgi:phenylpropionate dioxygenase-like ring-hydroxylating dioxygenase large terminal subunit
VCLFDRGKTRGFVCSYHGWSYGLDGALNGVPMEKVVFPDGLDKSTLGLEHVPRVANFQGLLFASFDPAAPAIEDWLGEDACWILENFVLSACVGGLELLPGWHRVHSPGNWKLAAENNIGDNYHVFSATHVAWLAVEHEFQDRGIAVPMATYPDGAGTTRYEVSTGLDRTVPLGLGMVLVDELAYKQDCAEAQKLGPEALEWVEYRYRRLQELQMHRTTKQYSFMNGGIFPNFGLMGFASPMIGRHFQIFHPRGPRAHEVWQWTMVEREAPQVVKELAAQRVYQGQHPAGVIGPDDVENFERIVEAAGPRRNWDRPNNYGMQLGHEADGPADLTGQAGPNPSDVNIRNFYRYWLEMMERG